MNFFNNIPDPIKYGLTTTGCIFFVGWVTGMGGSFGPNLGFSILMGLFAGALFWGLQRWFGRKDGGA